MRDGTSIARGGGSMTNPRTAVHSTLLAVVALFSLLGCHRGRYDGAAPQATERQLRNLVETAARDIPCAEATLMQQQIGEGLYAVQGCQRSREYLLMCEGRGARRCRWAPVTPVEQVAAAEMSCGQLMITQPSPITRDVSGCGQTVQYMIGCNVAGCAWGHAAGTATVAPVAVAPMQTAPAPAPTSGGSIAISADPQAQLLQIASDRWTQAQACMGGQHANATLTLGMDGRLTATLADPFHGTSVEQCVQSVVGNLTFTGQTASVAVVLTL
jgi:hypothetical protein